MFPCLRLSITSFSPSSCLTRAVYRCLLRLFQHFIDIHVFLSLSPSLHVCPRSSLPSSPPPSPPLWNAEMKIIGEVSKMQIVWVLLIIPTYAVWSVTSFFFHYFSPSQCYFQLGVGTESPGFRAAGLSVKRFFCCRGSCGGLIMASHVWQLMDSAKHLRSACN